MLVHSHYKPEVCESTRCYVCAHSSRDHSELFTIWKNRSTKGHEGTCINDACVDKCATKEHFIETTTAIALILDADFV